MTNTNKPFTTTGQMLQSARVKQKITLKQAAEATKIRSELLGAIEDGDFSVFASPVYSKAFVTTYGKFLGLDIEQLQAVFRRESVRQSQHPTKAARNADKPLQMDSRSRIRSLLQSQRFFAAVGVGIIGIVMLVYFVGQLGAVLAPPLLQLSAPLDITADFEGEIYVAGNSFRIEGKTSAQTVITFNSEVLPLEPGFGFSTPEIPLRDNQIVVVLTATNQFGRTSQIKLTVLKGSTGIATAEKLSGLIEVENEASSLLIRADGVITFNDRAFPGDIIQTDALQRLQIESDMPYNLIVTVNGEKYRFTERSKTWELIQGKILVK